MTLAAPWPIPVLFLLALEIVGTSGGCQRNQPAAGPTPASAATAEQPSADRVLERMVGVYKKAQSYVDQGTIRLSYRLDNQTQHDTAPFSLAFERSGRIRLRAYQTDLCSDGKTFTAQVKDESTNDLDGQWMVREAPPSWTVGRLLEDPVVYDVLSRGLGRVPIQLELLLDEKPLAGFLADTVQKRLLDDRRILDDMCYRVEVKTPEGAFVLWIDQASFLLRRLDYPQELVLDQLPIDARLAELRLTADFSGVTVSDTKLDDSAFRVEIPSASRQVRNFVRPPQPLASSLYGRNVGKYAFSQLDGQPLSNESLAGKIVVFHWYVDHPACRANMELLEQVRQKYATSERIQFLAVCVESENVTAESIRAALDEWQVSIPVVRDLNAVGRDVFAVDALPALVVLDEQNELQAFEISYQPELAEQLPKALDELLAGRDLAQDLLAQVQNDLAEYQQLLVAAGEQLDETSSSPIPRTEPANWRLEPIWTSPLAGAGNILVLNEAVGKTQICALEQGKSVVSFDEDGQIAQRLDLPLEPGDRATFLRAAEDGSAFAVGTPGGRRLYCFDGDWQLVRILPDAQVGHDGLKDAAFAKDPENGTFMLCAAFAGAAGVRAWKSNNDQLWEVALSHAQSVVPLPAGSIVTADAEGRLQRIDLQGRPQPFDEKVGHGIFRLQSTSCPVNSDTEAKYVGLCYDPDGQRVVYGLNGDFQARWEYRMPAGPHPYPVEWITSGLVPGEKPHWILASPDGAIHLLSFDGQEHDYYYSGTPIAGLATAVIGGQTALLVAQGDELTAWRFSPKENAVGTEADGIGRIAPPNQLYERR